VQLASHQHASLGYCCCNNKLTKVWTQAGQLQGTVWMKITTNASLEQVDRLRCLGPLLAVVDIFESNAVSLGEDQSLEEAVAEIERVVSGDTDGAHLVANNSKGSSVDDDTTNYESRFQKALQHWYDFAQQSWNDKPSSWNDTPIKYRLSCMRTESKKYQYSRQDLLTHVASCMVPARFQKQWSVDLTQCDLEIVLLLQQRSSSSSHSRSSSSSSSSSSTSTLAVGLALRPYAQFQARSFASGTVPADLSPPYLSSFAGLVRLRPTTAQVLLHLAQLQVGDVVLDPCAGVGTIPVEASMLTSKKAVFGIGGDLVLTDPSVRSVAIEYAQKSATVRREIGKGYSDIPCAWDATNLPIRDGIVDAVVSDLPFGLLCMSSSKLDSFLPLLMFEMARVLCPKSGRMVLLCGSYIPILEAMINANKRIQQRVGQSNCESNNNVVWSLPCSAVFPTNIGGNVAWVIVVHRGSADPVPGPEHAEQVKKLTGKRDRISDRMKKGNGGKPKRAQA